MSFDYWSKNRMTYFLQKLKDVFVRGVKGDSEQTYRTGNVNITPANLGINLAEYLRLDGENSLPEVEDVDTFKNGIGIVTSNTSHNPHPQGLSGILISFADPLNANSMQLFTDTNTVLKRTTAISISGSGYVWTSWGSNFGTYLKPIFTEASTRTNIASGETISTLFGKIKKWFSDLKTVAFTGSYNDLSNRPSIPSRTSDLTNDSGFITSAPLSDYLKRNGDQNYSNPTNHVNNFRTGIGLFNPIDIPGCPDNAHFWMIIATNAGTLGIQVAFALDNSTSVKWRTQHDTWSNWADLNVGLSDYVKNTSQIAQTVFNSYDFNSYTKSGFYRIGVIAGYTNAPSSICGSYGQLIVSANDDTVSQIYLGLGGSSIAFRTFNLSLTVVTPWFYVDGFDSGFIPVTSFNVSGITDNSGGAGTGYRKKNGYVTVTINLNGVSTLPNHDTLFALPEGYRPSNDIIGTCIGFNTGNSHILSVSTDGTVKLKTFENVGILVGAVTFPV